MLYKYGKRHRDFLRWFYFFFCGKCGGVMVSALVSGSSTPGFEPWLETLCCVHYLLSQCLSSHRCISECINGELNASIPSRGE